MAIEAYTGPGPKLVRTKSGILDDPDVFNPAVAVGPDDLEAMGCWALSGRRVGGEYVALTKILITVTFRNAVGAEIVGTFDADTFSVLQSGVSGDTTASSRRKVQKLGEATNNPSEEPMVQTVGRHDAFGIRLTNIAAVGATQVFVTVEEWG